MAEETAVAVAEAPETLSQTSAPPVNPALAKLLAREFHSGPREEVNADGRVANAEVLEEKPAGAKPAEKPVIQHEDLPPVELLTPAAEPKPAEAEEIPLPVEPPASLAKTEKGKADWKKWREDWEETKAENKKLKAAGANGAPTQEVVNLQAQNAQLLERMQQMSSVFEEVNIEKHPGFKAQYVIPRERMIAKAKSVLEMAEIAPEVFERAINLTGKSKVQALDELMEGVTSVTLRTQIGELVYGIEKLDNERSEVLQDIPKNHQRLEMERRAAESRESEKQQKQNHALLGQVFEALRDKGGYELLREVEGNEKWNASRREKLEEARYYLQNANPVEAMGAAVLSTLAPEYRKWALAETKRANALEKELAELRGADPKLTGRTTSETAAEDLSGPAAILAKTWAVPGK